MYYIAQAVPGVVFPQGGLCGIGICDRKYYEFVVRDFVCCESEKGNLRICAFSGSAAGYIMYSFAPAARSTVECAAKGVCLLAFGRVFAPWLHLLGTVDAECSVEVGRLRRFWVLGVVSRVPGASVDH